VVPAPPVNETFEIILYFSEHFSEHHKHPVRNTGFFLFQFCARYCKFGKFSINFGKFRGIFNRQKIPKI
jgi:hypothetical protein